MAPRRQRQAYQSTPSTWERWHKAPWTPTCSTPAQQSKPRHSASCTSGIPDSPPATPTATRHWRASMEAKAREDRPHTWHDLQAVADHLADHGASDEEILSALATDNARWGVRVVRHAMITFADRALERGGGCDCNGPKPVGVKRGKDYYLRLDMDIVDWWMPWLGEAELKVLW